MVPTTKNAAVTRKVHSLPIRATIAPPRAGPRIAPTRAVTARQALPSGKRRSGSIEGRIAPDAGNPSASPAPIMKTTRAIIHVGRSVTVTKTKTTVRIARKRSAEIMMYLRLYRSAQTPPARARITEDRTREARIRPRVVAVPPASRMVTASAIGKAEEPMTTRSPDNQSKTKSRCSRSFFSVTSGQRREV